MAMLVQYLSAKAGIATGMDLPELCRTHFRRPVSRGLWVQAEIVAMATDLAEFVGAAIGLNLLFGVPLFPAGLITAVVAFGDPGAGAARATGASSWRSSALLGIVLLGFGYDLLAVGAQPAALAAGLVPSFGGDGGVLLAAGIIGATVMPHVVYLHSALTKARVACRDDGERRELLRFTRIDVRRRARHRRPGQPDHAGRRGLAVRAHRPVRRGHHRGRPRRARPAGRRRRGAGLRGRAARVRAVVVLSVGTYAGQVVMQGFIRRRIPLLLRRGLTMLPALVVLAPGPAGHREPGRLAGRAVVRDPVRAGAAGAADPARGRDGRASSTSGLPPSASAPSPR